MKLAIRIFALSAVVAGVTAASMSSTLTPQHVMVSSQAAHAGLPTPTCGPGMGCPTGR